jgi:hypothetical protein
MKSDKRSVTRASENGEQEEAYRDDNGPKADVVWNKKPRRDKQISQRDGGRSKEVPLR